ncbi:hypothetical protein FY034_18020 (plasmid) [Trichlorobacter lovleyi]|uniref:hypothetical protein n=1 Tax=Trichlorobacter lovleyi TaxID=313985 RepID=UPI002240D498|nr:hypothetical protein [Trichlorobacter lovleyi]QOX80898.1 hypothetical protein FY034_18020 [Trichlorobacter lovleyi]
MNLKNNTFKGPDGETLNIELKTFSSGQLKVQLWVKEEEGYLSPAGCLSVNEPGAQLAKGEFVAKDWCENEELAVAALQSGLFEDTGRRIQNGYVKPPIWRIKEVSDVTS